MSHMPNPEQLAEARIEELAISSVHEIDVEAIAYDAGVSVTYKTLQGCAATLVGFGDRAIATISPSGSAGRDRFSIAHEVGHWEMHRGHSFVCRVDNPANNFSQSISREREADRFASQLLMPTALFNPAISAYKWPSLKKISEIATDFQTSQIATILRMVKVDRLAAIVACFTKTRRLWYIFADHIPRGLRLKENIEVESFAYDLLFKGIPKDVPGKQSADVWFDNPGIDDYEVSEQCYSLGDERIIVLLYLTQSEVITKFGYQKYQHR